VKQPESAVILVRPHDLNHGGQVLLCARRENPDRWSLPGGKAEPDEWVWDAAVRELHEETGLNARPDHLRLFYAQRFEGRFVHFFALARWATMSPIFEPSPAPGEPACRWGEMSELFDRKINPFASFYENALKHERRIG
jgi:ADP-ribose pyrophosphatase YjhB (NUDIX family)